MCLLCQPKLFLECVSKGLDLASPFVQVLQSALSVNKLLLWMQDDLSYFQLVPKIKREESGVIFFVLLTAKTGNLSYLS